MVVVLNDDRMAVAMNNQQSITVLGSHQCVGSKVNKLSNETAFETSQFGKLTSVVVFWECSQLLGAVNGCRWRGARNHPWKKEQTISIGGAGNFGMILIYCWV